MKGLTFSSPTETFHSVTTQLAVAGLAMQNGGLNRNESRCMGLQGLGLREKNHQNT